MPLFPALNIQQPVNELRWNMAHFYAVFYELFYNIAGRTIYTSDKHETAWWSATVYSVNPPVVCWERMLYHADNFMKRSPGSHFVLWFERKWALNKHYSPSWNQHLCCWKFIIRHIARWKKASVLMQFKPATIHTEHMKKKIITTS